MLTRRSDIPTSPCEIIAPRPDSAAPLYQIVSRRARPRRDTHPREARREAQLKALVTPYPSHDMICWPVSARAGNVKNNDSSLIDPIAAG
jgi:hypothetical protein